MQRIALLCGGTSSEREVSLRSGANVADALRNIGHRVTVHDLRADTLEGIDLHDASFAFIVMHGGWGEGGGVQAELEKLGLPYSGSDACSSRLALDKELTKAAFLRQRVPTPEHDVVTRADATVRARRFAARHGFPLAVKPVCQGSSIGVSIVKDAGGLDAALEEAFKWDERVMVERGIVGRELTVAIIGARAYPVIEVAPSRDFYDYSAKYADPGTRYITKPDLDPMVDKMARHFAKRAHNSVRCHGYSRTDMMLDQNGGLHVLEVNTLPGMTSRSLLPLAAAQAGMSYEEALQAMIDASLAPRKRIGVSARIDTRGVSTFTA